MTQVSGTHKNEERLARAIASVKIYEEFGFATVASTSEVNKFYFVDFDKNFYATACSCKGNAEYGKDCLHALAFDRAADNRRPDFYTMNGIVKPAKQVAPLVTVGEIITWANEAIQAPAPDETHRVTCVRGAAGPVWYPEYKEGGEWYRFPLEGTTHAVHFLDASPERAQEWLRDHLAEVEGARAEAKYMALKRGFDEQYASDPRTSLTQTERETSDSNLRAFYNDL